MVAEKRGEAAMLGMSIGRSSKKFISKMKLLLVIERNIRVKCNDKSLLLCKLRCMLNFERSRNQRQGSEFFKGSGIHEVVSRCFPHQWRFLKSCTWRNRTDNPCVVSPHA